ncbi:MAG: DUF3576 domain-containing protein [Minwuia sp.]|uniref:DUF3576 domain-containing protein n=1 Tax=Minwuia sp. TaxID=2493630 RepID=UPI003A85661C
MRTVGLTLSLRSLAGLLTIFLSLSALGGCSSLNPFSDDEGETSANQSVTPPATTAGQVAAQSGAPANPFMWQATLEHVGFMPFQKVDDQEGVIVTDWYIPPGAPLERFRLDVAFSSRALRAEAISIDVFRQELNSAGQWFDAPSSPEVSRNMIDSIIARALVLRQDSGAL